MALDQQDSTATDLTMVVPVWDRYVSLLPSLVSRLHEEAPGATIVVVDNASNVPLPELGVSVVRLSSRRTTGAARNAALSAVSTRFVFFFDADDLPVAGTLGRLLEIARRRPECVAVAGTSIAWHPRSSEEVKIGYSDRIFALQNRPRLFGVACLIRNRFPVVGSILQAAAVEDAGGFSDLNYCEDWGLATALAFRGPVCLVQDPALMSRIHEGSMIHREGTPAGIVRMLGPLYRRWISDAAIPWWAKILFLGTPFSRLRQAVKRKRSHARSHDDLFAVLGRHSLAEYDAVGESRAG
jgi:glycosyltransferase involved in cell wall biosynthesis